MFAKLHSLLHHTTESLMPETLDPPGKHIRNHWVHFLVSRSKKPSRPAKPIPRSSTQAKTNR